MLLRTVESHEHDEQMMDRALRLARRGEGHTRPNPPVGAVVVQDGVVVGEGYHRRAGAPHAEVNALRGAGDRAAGATLFVTLEPCSTHGQTPPCTDLILRSGIRRVVIGVRDPNPVHAGRGIRILRKAGIGVKEGIARHEAAALIAPFAKWVTTGQPVVTLKMAMTLDGRIADPQGESKWITGPSARKLVQTMRRRSDVVMVGSSTICRDNPSLLVHQGRRGHDGLRVVVDSQGRLPLSAQILTDGHAQRTIVATTSACPEHTQAAIRNTGAAVWVLRQAQGRVSLKALMRQLGRRGVLHVLCEGGGALAASLVQQRLVDEYAFFVAPKFLGAKGVPVLGNLGATIKNAPALVFYSCERIGDDFLFRARSLGRQ